MVIGRPVRNKVENITYWTLFWLISPNTHPRKPSRFKVGLLREYRGRNPNANMLLSMATLKL
eukprot:3953739-Pyramimonas_sp.AAC.1